MKTWLGVCAVTVLGWSGVAAAHGGGLNAQGCHNDRRNGGYHCHRSPVAVAAPPRRQSFGPGSGTGFESEYSGGGSYANCSAARAAGAAPVRRGDPGYGAHLDRDGDGVGCE